MARAELKRANAEREAPKPHSLLPDRHRNKNFFSADLLEFTLKDDRASMEIPLFTLSTRPDLSVWTWASQDGNKHIEVYPSVKGRATQFDKDVLIYIISQLTQGLNLGREDAKCRCIRFVVYDYLLTTNKLTGDIASQIQITLMAQTNTLSSWMSAQTAQEDSKKKVNDSVVAGFKDPAPYVPSGKAESMSDVISMPTSSIQ